MNWFVVRTKPQQEFRAEENLTNQGFEIYLPRFSFAGCADQPLFNGYLFLSNELSAAPFMKIRSTRGVLGIVRFGDNMAVAPHALIQEIRLRELNYKEVRRFNPNDIVRVKSGPFANLNAIYVCKNGDERAIILLNWLNRANRIEIDERQLEST